ncbi:LysR family transcriptional regulator ArgP [Acinetobacter sp. MD2(2019)]|uniref:LysR family transcriptional regulator ArgP n=1 Tax=Acinetobacter sp. MD2(2019) TaxID=2605273 RepID=UPI002D1F0615|nr:LysR family transcriptional regulator ArgP [Acinetobacter sp. MD2(2019)]MEB3753790.1 LysR family transcriptional regulator ArgP [Acinetobacter sp. MD2(2019)]
MLDYKQADAFLAVIETGSFEHAGLKLCVTASAVSLRVQALEKELGQLLVLRGRPCTATQAGLEVLEYLQHCNRLEQNLLHHLKGHSEQQFFKVTLATNADSLATWLLPLLQPVLLRDHIALELKLDDQSRTYNLLETGAVNACISIESKPMKGCESQLLGVVRYKMVATPEFYKKWFKSGLNREALRTAPALIFNHHDQMHIQLLYKLFGLAKGTYPCHFIPSSESFVHAIHLGLGYGMVPEFQIKTALQNNELIEILPEARTEMELYWHHWKRQSAPLAKLTEHLIRYAPTILK